MLNTVITVNAAAACHYRGVMTVGSSEWDAAERGCYMALAMLEADGVTPSTHEVVDVVEYEVQSDWGDYTLARFNYIVAPKHADEALWDSAANYNTDWA